MHLRALFLLPLAALLTAALPVSAQWTTQTISLRPGWNAIFLEVQPEPHECDAVLAGLPIETVWRWNKRFSAVQFIRDPNEIIAEPAAWLVWIPPGHPLTDRSNPAADRTSLYLLEGGFPYLIKSTNASTITWNVRGRPVQRKTQWVADALNLAGFGLPSSSPPSYQSFFGGVTGFTNASQATPAIYRLNTSGAWVQVLTPATTFMQRGEAFWIRALGLPKFQGPLEIQTDRRAGLDFGRTLTEQTIKISNAATNTRTVILRPLASETPLAPTEPALAGDVPLSYWRNEFGTTNVGWANFPSQIQSNIPPGGVWELRLEARRRDMAVPPTGNSRYQSLLEIADAAGLSRQVLPVVADGLLSTVAEGGGGFAPAGDPPPVHPRAGLQNS